MNRRIAKKIVRSFRDRDCLRYSVDQWRRALLRVYRSPLQLTDRDAHWRDDGFRMPLGTFGRCVVLTDKLCVLEQRGQLHDVRRREGRLEFHRRPFPWENR